MALFKILGLRYNDPATPINEGEYLSAMHTAKYGDILVDEDGNAINFGLIGIPYNDEPDCSDMTLGETRLWYNPFVKSVYAMTKELDGICHVSDLGFTSDAYMLKSVYDPSDSGIVTSAFQLSDGGSTNITAADVSNHINDLTIHAPLSDLTTSIANLWSALKTKTYIDDHTWDASDIVSGIFDPARLPVFDGVNQGVVPVPQIGATSSALLRTDATWLPIALSDISDFDLSGAERDDLMVYDGTEWVPMVLSTTGSVEITYDYTYNTITFGAGTLGLVSTITPPGSTELGATERAIVDYVTSHISSTYMNDIVDVDAAYPNIGDVLMFNGTDWMSTLFTTDTGIQLTFDIGTRTFLFENILTLDAARLNGDTFTDNVNLTSVPTLDDHITNKLYVDNAVQTANELSELTDTDITYVTAGQLLSYNGTFWVNTDLLTGTGIDITYDALLGTYTFDNTLTLDEARLNGDTFTGYVNITVVPTLDDHVVNKLYVDSLASSGTLAGLTDTLIQYPAASQMLVYNGSDWQNITLSTTGNIDITYDIPSGTLTFNVDDDTGLEWTKITTDTFAVSGVGYGMVASTDLTLTLPLYPNEGDTVGIVDANGSALSYTLTVARNGSNIQGIADDLVINTARSGFVLVYIDDEQGWVITTEIAVGVANLVIGPASAIHEHIAVYDGTTGKLIKDGGYTIAELIASVPATTPGGVDTNVQFNNAGAFGGDATFTWDGTTLSAAALDIANGAVFNSSAADNDFTINKLTSGTAYVYDAGTDWHTFNSSGGNFIISGQLDTTLSLFRMQSASSGIEMYGDGYSTRLRIGTDAGSNRSVITQYSTSGTTFDMQFVTSEGTGTAGDFIFDPGVGGDFVIWDSADADAYRYDSVADTHLFDGTTITLTAPADGSLLSNHPTGGTPLAIATVQYVDTAVGAGAAGADTNIQFNSSGSFAGSADFTWDDVSKTFVVGGDTTINGNMTINGTQFIQNVETVLVKDNTMMLNYGETGAGVTAGVAGIVIDRGTENNYGFVFEESTDTFRVGEFDYEDGSEIVLYDYTQAVATREDTPVDTGVAFWNDSDVRFDTSANFTWDGTALAVNATTVTFTTPANGALLSSQPTGTVDLAIATTKYVDDAVVAPGGADTNVQYNNAGAFGGDANFTYDGAGTIDLSAKVQLGGANALRTSDGDLAILASTFVGNTGNTTAAGNAVTLVGASAGASITSGQTIVAIGSSAGDGITTANSIVAIGGSAGRTIGQYGTAVGSNAASKATVAVDALGYTAANAVTTGVSNCALGRNSLKTVTTGAYNTAVGSGAMLATTNTCTGNVAVGQGTGLNITANENTLLGAQAGAVCTGTNVMIGYQTGLTVTGSGNVLIGSDVAQHAGAISNELWIHNTVSATPLIHGNFATPALTFNCAADLAQLQNQPTGAVPLAVATTYSASVWASGVTGSRPTPVLGLRFFDTTLGYPIWYNGTNWVNATGATV